MDWLTFVLALSTALLAVATLVMALATRTMASEQVEATRLLRKTVAVGAVQTISQLLGTFERTIERRDALRKTLTKQGDGRTEILSLKNVEAAQKDEVAANIANVSRAFDRAGWAVVTFMSANEIEQFLNVVGDAYMDFWAICFEWIGEQQDKHGDHDNRM